MSKGSEGLFSNGFLHCIGPSGPLPTTERFGAIQEDSLGLNGGNPMEQKQKACRREDTHTCILRHTQQLLQPAL